MIKPLSPLTAFVYAISNQESTPVNSSSGEYRNAIWVFDRYFGMYTTFALVVAITGWIRNEITTNSVIVLGAYVACNIVVSQISLRSKNPVFYELFRYIIMGTLLAPLTYIFTGGAIVNWWQAYFIFSLASGVSFHALTRKQTYALVLVPYWTLNFLVVNFFWIENPNWYSVLLDASTIFLGGTLMIKLTSIISSNLVKEQQNSKELQDTLVQLNNTQSELIQTKKIAALGEMASGVAHEINNPLTIITLLSAQIKKSMREEAFDKQKVLESLTKIESTAERIGTIVTALKTFSKESKVKPSEVTTADKIIANAITLCGEKIRNLGIALTVEDIPEGMTVYCREMQISEALLNLIFNSAEAIAPQSEKWIKISVKSSKNNIEIAVTDSGPGIPAGLREKIFQPFFTTKDIGQGTGMGLSMSLGILQNNYGDLTLNISHPNTQFVMSLKKTQEATVSK